MIGALDVVEGAPGSPLRLRELAHAGRGAQTGAAYAAGRGCLVTMAPTRNNEAPEAKAWRWSAVEGSAPLSRHVFQKWLARVEATQHEENGSLLFSELFSNALRYPAPDRLVPTRWFRLDDFIRVEVDDASPKDLVITDPGIQAESGRGLILVHLLADKWGVNHRRFNDGHGNYLNGKTVWFELHDE